MHKFKVIVSVMAAFSLSLGGARAVQARSVRNSHPNNVIGQVTVTNVDSGDNSIKLSGASVKITDKDTGKVYTDTIKADGTLVYELPLGSYSLAQELAPNDYALNTRVFEFTLQLPGGADASSIKAVNASVMISNDRIGGDSDLGAGGGGDEEGLADEEPEEGGAAAEPSARPAPADKNPVTGDNSNILLAFLVFLGIILTGGAISLNRVNSGFRRISRL